MINFESGLKMHGTELLKFVFVDKIGFLVENARTWKTHLPTIFDLPLGSLLVFGFIFFYPSCD